MALHPKAQKRLLSYLRKFCSINHCLCIVSTQSASLIKITDPKKILFLDNAEDGTLICRNNVYPAAILGELAFSEEILPEVIILVEDHEAAMLMEEIVNKLKMTMNVDFPYCKILPVGGYLQVVHLLDNLSRVFPDYVKKRAVLDKDAEPQLQKMNKDAFRSQHSVVSRNYENLYFLPCTPEQGVITLLENNPDKKSQELNQVFQSDLIRLSDVFSDERYRAISGDSRSDCKDKMELLVHYLLRLFSEPEYYIKRKLYKYYIQKRYPDTGVLKKEYCEIIFKN